LKSVLALFLALILFLNSVQPLYADTENAPEIHGEAAYLIDVQSGQTLYNKNGDKQLAPASTTKIMTGLLAIEQGNLNEIVTASPTMLNYKIVYGTRIYMEPGEQLSLENMLYALLLNSANDAAVAIAEHIGGDLPQFVTLMNQRAKALGLKNTTFKNPSGLTEEGHLTTAHDLARIAQEAYSNPIFKDYIKTKTRVIPRAKENVPFEMINENKLLWRDDRITGMKTGYTAAAGNCLVTSATKDGRDLIGVILKSPGREIYTDMQALLNYGFNQFENTAYKASGDSITQIQVQSEDVNLITQIPLWVTHKKGDPFISPIIKVLPVPTHLTQIEAGQVLTQLEIWEGEERIAVIPLSADRSVRPEVVKDSRGILYILILVSGSVFIFICYRKASARRRLRRNRIIKKRS
jgi:serine-type D-Ala-D-Ala carboxypeptidase (penicillin-binding protein 5/6)